MTVVLAGALTTFIHFSNVHTFAEIESDVRLQRLATDPNLITLTYTPLTRGIIRVVRIEDEDGKQYPHGATGELGAEHRMECRWEGLETGDRIVVTSRHGWSRGRITLEVPAVEQPVTQPIEPADRPSKKPRASPPKFDAIVAGRISDATTNRAIIGATVTIPGTDLSAQTDDGGEFRIVNAPTGPTTIKAVANTFRDQDIECELVSGQNPRTRFLMSPTLEAGEIRFILAWDNLPADLDAHLVGPLPAGGTFHLSARIRETPTVRQSASLDISDADGGGPETITLRKPVPGTYHYFVHDFSNNDSAESTALAASNAEVHVHFGERTRHYQTSGRRVGNVWHVCDIVVTEELVRVERINQFETRKLDQGHEAFDIVFLLDCAVSPDFLKQTKQNCRDYIQTLTNGGIDARFGMIGFDRREPQRATPTSPPGPAATVMTALAETSLGIPPDRQLDSLAAALDRALFFSYREDASVIFMMISPNDPKNANRLKGLARQLQARKIETIIFADPTHQDSFADLAKNGRLISLTESAEPPAALTNTTPRKTDPKSSPREFVATVRNVDDLLSRFSFDSTKSDVESAIGLIGRYRRRTLPERYKWIEEFGGNRQSEDAVALGLNWLARHQATDGHWGKGCLQNGPHRRCRPGTLCPGPGDQQHAMALTGLATLAFQAGGQFDFNEQKYSQTVRRGLDWMVQHQRSNGLLIDPTHRQFNDASGIMYEHGIATFALCEACAVAKAASLQPHPRYLNAARRAVNIIVNGQGMDGGWRYSFLPNAQGDSSVSGWQVLALKSAREAGIQFPATVISRATSFFRGQETNNGRTMYAGENVDTEATTGIGMLFHQLILEKPDAPLVTTAARYLTGFASQRWGVHANNWRQLDKSSPKGRITISNADYYMWYNCTLAMFHVGGDEWKAWNPVIRDVLIGLQDKDQNACLCGSWDTDSKWGFAGRIYTTSLAVLTLEVYYRYEAQKQMPFPPAAP